MPPTDAYIMDNWFPNPASVAVRNGSEAWATTLPGNVLTLAAYNGTTSNKLFAASGTAIYDVTSSGAATITSVTGLTNVKFQFVNMGTIGGRFLCMFNGADDGKYFDGTNWISVSLGGGATQISGVNPQSIINVNIYKNRMFLVEKNTASVWYLGLNAIYGAASKLDFSSLLNLGGNIVAMTTWTVDNTAGMNEYAVFISSLGEVLVYSGSDPSSATDWSLSNRFNIGRPAGYRCFERVGSDVIIIGADGAFPLSKALVTDRAQAQYAITDKIVNLVSTDFQSYADHFGWQLLLYPIGSKLVLNVPYVDGAASYQYVMNVITGAWCRFTGWNAFCFGKVGDSLYYGGNTKVYKCDYGTSDDGANIVADCQQAFQYFGSSAQKLFTAARPIIQSNGAVRPSFAINVDYDTTKPTGVSTFNNANFTPWNSPWYSPWSIANQVRKDWLSVTGYGFSGGPRMSVSIKRGKVSWQSTDIVFELGGVF